MPTVYDLSPEELTDVLTSWGEPGFRAAQVHSQLWRRAATYDRVTVCVSSQAGCAMGCGFCATGQMGLLGNLTAGEIAAQVLWARREPANLPDTTPRRLTNVVFMGMGEPKGGCSKPQ